LDNSWSYPPLSAREEEIGRQVVDAAYKVHVQLGPGLLEKAYEACLFYELQKRGLFVERQVSVPITYDGKLIDDGFRADLLVEHMVVVELKAVQEMHPVYEAQILSYLQLLNRRLGYLINFHVLKIKDGISRYVK
jgi:GxxExxY protein